MSNSGNIVDFKLLTKNLINLIDQWMTSNSESAKCKYNMRAHVPESS